MSFIAAKTCVVPLKALTIPRLELMAALIVTRLTHFVINAIPLSNPSVYMWSNSQIVLHWIKSQKPLQFFARNWITEINSLLPSAIWNYCSTADNPADLLSRGSTAESLMSSWLWQHDPKWLTTPGQWQPLQPPPPFSPLVLAAAVATEFVSMQQKLSNVGLHCVITIDCHSSLPKLLTVTAYDCRFIVNCRTQPLQRLQGPVSAEELHWVSLKWVKDVQQSIYWKEIANLQLISRQSRTARLPLVRQLRLFLDSDGLLCCGGRIHNAPVSEATKFPLLLPSRNPLSRLIILDIHIKLCHSGTNATLTGLRQSYWIPTARHVQYVKSILHHCVTCHKVNGRPYAAPDPPPLPQLRTQDVCPFTFTGVDFTRALHVDKARR